MVSDCERRSLHEALEHHLAAGFVEVDGELVAIDERDGARPEFQMEHPRAFGEG